MRLRFVPVMRHKPGESKLIDAEGLSAAGYANFVREQDAAFVRHLSEAYARGEFPAECYPSKAA